MKLTPILSWKLSTGKVIRLNKNNYMIALGLMDYPQVIKRPMDLGTVKVKDNIVIGIIEKH